MLIFEKYELFFSFLVLLPLTSMPEGKSGLKFFILQDKIFLIVTVTLSE